MDWLRKRVRKWLRARAARLDAPGLPALKGAVKIAAVHPSGAVQSPVLRTVLQPSLGSPCLLDTEIRGFLDGAVKLERNVATQYHVRIGCEGSKPQDGRYEVMRVLHRWQLDALPRCARIHSARIVLCQESLADFPHRNPQVWPVDFYVYAVRKPWGPGRGGVKRDNQSAPEPGDAWWLEAKAGELPWSQPGCGFASDSSPGADRGEEALASGRVAASSDPLVLEGPRLAAHVERALSEGQALELIIKAGELHEAKPGSIKAFYSAEHGDGITPAKRPRLELDWTAPAEWSLERDYVLEPGESLELRREAGDGSSADAQVHGSIRTEAGSPFPPLLRFPVLSAAPHPVAAGEALSIRILETWTPDVRRPEDLAVIFRFTAPSGREVETRARFVGDFTHAGEVQPDELGVWSYAWSVRPDRRFPPQEGSGWFTVVPGDGEPCAATLRSFAESAVREANESRGALWRRRSRARLTLLLAELQKHEGSKEAAAQVAAALAKVE